MQPAGVPGQSKEAAVALVVEGDRPCHFCGYNLRDLPVQGHCPECGVEIARSLSRRLFRYSDPRHVRTLHRGAVLVEVSLALGVAATVVLFALTWFVRGITGWSAGALEFLSALVWLAIGLLGAMGWWWLSSPDPGGDLGGSEGRSRSLLRWTVVGYVAAATGSFVVSISAIGSALTSPLVPGLAFTAAGLRVLQHLASLYYVRTLAPRIPSRRIAEAVRSLTTFGIVLTIPAAVMLSLAVGAMLRWKLGILSGLWCLTFPLAISLVIWYLMYVSMIDRIRVELHISRRAAGRPPGEPDPIAPGVQP